MFSGILRRRKRAISWLLIALMTFVFLCMWNYNSLDSSYPYSSIHRFRLFGGAWEYELPADFYKLKPDDPALVEIVRYKFMRPPSSTDYNLTRPNVYDFSRGQSDVIDKQLNHKKVGFFVECGAYDGEHQSVSLYFERVRRWRGVLIEPDLDRYNKLVKKHRNAITMNVCVRTDLENIERPEKSTESAAFFQARSRDDPKAVPCFWLTTLLLATQQKSIDLLSLDLHKKEIDTLRTIDYTKVNIQTVTLEVPLTLPESNVGDMINYMRSHGFQALHQFSDLIRKTKDIVLKKGDT